MYAKRQNISGPYKLCQSQNLPKISSKCFPERVCEPATYDVYGITTIDGGKNRLKGPSVAADTYGVTQMGGRTPHR